MEIIKVVLTTLLSAAAIFILTKMMGHKQVSQLDLFDYINGITMGSIAAELATEIETPTKPLAALVVYSLIALCLSIITNKFPKTQRFINGSPVVIISNGKIYRKSMKKAKINLSELLMMCRQEGYFDLQAIEVAVFEFNGKLTVLPKSEEKPATPKEMNLTVQKAPIFTEIIMDGKVMTENIKRLGYDETWLRKSLAELGYGKPSEVFLCVCDDSGKVMVYDGK